MQIEKNIPLPTFTGHNKGYTQLVKDMVSGDSVVVPTKSGSGFYAAAARFGKKAVCRKIDDDNIRVWIV